MDTTKLVYITDQSHSDFHVLIARWRQVDAFTIEYRDGGVWSRLHVSQFALVDEAGG
jgi:hypothetical protein